MQSARRGFRRRESTIEEGHVMTTSEISARRLSDAEHRVQLRRAAVASTVGTIIEAYDFLLYVQVAPLVFAKLFFPSSDPLVGTLQAFGGRRRAPRRPPSCRAPVRYRRHLPGASR